ncbi:MAG: hydrogenase maturation nickel metallochaperone HypA [Lachnospiraceae bacterium]|nr:hydrogenase maturation nickel metallochaperone HypA [Lachnospiraceae bacterium]
MHELSYMIRMVDTALVACKENDLTSVDELVIKVGETTGLIPHFLEDYYPQCIKGTILEGSKLTVNFIPVTARCDDCGTEYQPSRENSYKCPKCGSIHSKIIGGREFTLERIIGD